MSTEHSKPPSLPNTRILAGSEWAAESDNELIKFLRSLAPDLTCLHPTVNVGCSWPGFRSSPVASKFLFWSPNGIPVGDTFAVVSSRLNQKLDEQTGWFDALRTIAVQLARRPKVLITAANTTTDPFIRRIAYHFGIPLIVFEPFPVQPIQSWARNQIDRQPSAAPRLPDGERDPSNLAAQYSTVFFQALDVGDATANRNAQNPDPDVNAAPNINDLLISIAQTSVLLSVRNQGNIARAAFERLRSDSTAPTRLLINRKLTPKSVERPLLKLGATAWWLYRDRATSPTDGPVRSPIAKIVSLPDVETNRYLIHWTRRRVGPWPDQSHDEYLDDLIFQTTRREHSQVFALCRILAARRILGSNRLTRDSRSLVCFSDVPLNEIQARRVFRPHLGRWDFEPYGLAIDRDWLRSLGAQPVIYGTEAEWEKLSVEQRPFFQTQNSKSKKIDWRLEQEWRIVGDLNLEQIPIDRAVVFVNTIKDAEIVQDLSLWPIVVLERDESSRSAN